MSTAQKDFPITVFSGVLLVRVGEDGEFRYGFEIGTSEQPGIVKLPAHRGSSLNIGVVLA